MSLDNIETENVSCSHCNSDVRIPRKLKGLLDAAEIPGHLPNPEKLRQAFEQTQEFQGMPFFVSPLTGNVYCNWHCYHLYCED